MKLFKLHSTVIVVRVILIVSLSFLLNCDQLINKFKGTDSHKSARMVQVHITGDCVEAVTFSKWKHDDIAGWESNMTYNGGRVGNISYIAYGVNDIKIDEYKVSISADLKRGETGIAKIACVDWEKITRIVVNVGCY
ncbi:MAG: hypothetical protein J7K40_12440 [candidate division Zixibacteria bacterium]|nr:hypothetical protein [candidate division Zixibacteria bacterium]